MKKKLVLSLFIFLAFSSAGCLTTEVEHVADALDRFSAQIEATTHPEKGHLKQLIDQTSSELRALVKQAKDTGKEITADFMLKWAEERKETLEQIRILSKDIFDDSHVLVTHLQVAGISVPLQLGDELEVFSEGLRSDVRSWLAVTHFSTFDRNTLAGYSGLTWTERAGGYYEMKFHITDAPALNLSVGGSSPIMPAKPPIAGEIMFRVPVSPGIRALFDDQQEKGLGFTLLEADPKKPPTEWKSRVSGWVVLLPRFPIEYSFRVISPGAEPTGEARVIDQGPAIDELVRSTIESGVARAERHGTIYRIAQTHLPAGASKVVIPRLAAWSLTLTFPDGKSEVLTGGKYRVQNDFGRVTVTPNLVNDTWTLLIDVEPK